MSMKQAVRHALQRSSVGSLLLRSYRSMTGVPPSPDSHWARIVMDRSTRGLIGGLNLDELDALEISGSAWCNFGFRSYQSRGFPDFDICRGGLDAKFDLVIAEQVFEHLLHPYKAARNVFEMLRPGGRFLVTTPFLVRVHDYPVDCSRWTELGLKHFLEECGFPPQFTETRSWGNRQCVISNLKQWTAYVPGLHSLRNEPDFPIVVWALARRPPCEADMLKSGGALG
jgi:SAM-dependent methyltransferase